MATCQPKKDMCEVDDISRVLYSVFDGIVSETVFRSDVVRLWSLEMQWFSPQDAERVIDALIDSGWIKQEKNTLQISSGVDLIIPGLGWRPITRRMLSPPRYSISQNEGIKPTSDNLSKPRVSKSNEIRKDPAENYRYSEPRISSLDSEKKSVDYDERNIPLDRAEGSIPHLIELIANQSGLENKEVVRRAQRKRRALGPVTLWMALALVAREQGLAMDKVSDVIENLD